ncbi:gfo/Idh/MocA family oxidoreductase [Natronococcus pandeyae]|uniref:Gfo/Idh/MocA family oxidoreductase n=1 Tax=Natronococcus pandeyae TaxID=2055836 RepID=A0A8J8Q007_9EURY|nr:Gfo/Idh/MocA family oxidoreductase [Natronococcus pandeyae]TYL37961.1 gfo/Idh/MocA family oxidoreductase [Natronococcus pandeyae]
MTASVEPVSVGILSTAHVHTDEYARLLVDRGDADLVGIADEDPDRGRETAARHGVDYVPDADALLERIDAAVVCSTNARHAAWIDRAADAGVDVLCEKPLAPSLEATREIVERRRERGIALGVAMPLRFSEPAKRAKRALESDEIGDLLSISGTNRGRMPGGWFVDPEESGGGAVMDHTVHIVDLVSHLTGERVEEVYAETGTRFHDIDVEDVNVLSMRLTDGTTFLLDGSWSKPDAWHTWGDATVEFVGREGTIAVDCFDQSVRHTKASGEDEGIRSVFCGTDPNAGLIGDFVTSVADGRDPAVMPEDALEAVAVVEAAYESAATGEPVEVRY